MPWWTWTVIGLAVSGAVGVAVFVFRHQLRYFVKVTKALATDKRLPRPLRWALTVALAIKVVPVPDFGLDEVILLVVVVLLLTLYRPTFRAILEESRYRTMPSWTAGGDEGAGPRHPRHS